MVNYLTSRDNGHTHMWNPEEKKTSKDAGHSHPIDLKKKLALPNGTGHSHKLITRKYSNS